MASSPLITMKTKNDKGQSLLMGKWSSKAADHNAIRVRNNQRRHRARVKSRMEDLESQIQEASARLDAALATIDDLTAEINVLRNCHGSPSPRSPTHVARRRERPAPTRSVGTDTALDGMLDNATPSACQLSSVSPVDDDEMDADCGCSSLPPTSLGESTLSCNSAFRIIKQQDVSGIEVATIRAKLSSGFRRSLVPGEACRVETSRVYELLDRVTSRI